MTNSVDAVPKKLSSQASAHSPRRVVVPFQAMSDDIYISVSLEGDEDEPVADIVYRGVQWASLKLDGDTGVLTLYAGDGRFDLPLEDALASVEEAKARLRKLG